MGDELHSASTEDLEDARAAEVAGAAAAHAAGAPEHLTPGSSGSGACSACSSSGVSVVSCAQWRQIRRSSRWAITPSRLEREQEGRHAQILHARHRAERVVGVQRGEHQVAGERGLDRVLRRLRVADLAHHDDVRVLAQDVAQRAGEVEPDLGLHLHLVEARPRPSRSGLRSW